MESKPSKKAKRPLEISIHPILALDESLAGGRGMTDCERIGIMGGCGLSCPMLLAGKCPSPEGMLEDENGE